MNLLDVTPKSGSLGGGQILTISGYGFNKQPSWNGVNVNYLDPISGKTTQHACEMTGADIHPNSSKISRMFCKTPESPAPLRAATNVTISTWTRYVSGSEVRVVAQGKQREWDQNRYYIDDHGELVKDLYSPALETEAWSTSLNWIHPTTKLEHRIDEAESGCRSISARRYNVLTRSVQAWRTCYINDGTIDSFREWVDTFERNEILVLTIADYVEVDLSNNDDR